MLRRLRSHRQLPLRAAAVLLALAAVLGLAAVVAPRRADGAQEGRLRKQIDSQRKREGSLAFAAARLGKLERTAAREVAVLSGRLGTAQTEYDAAQTRLERTQADLRAARRRVTRLRARLTEVRDKLSTLLRERYVTGQPDLVTVVLDARGFNDLLETVSFLRRVEDSDTQLLGLVRGARVDAGREQRTYVALERRRTTAADAQRRRRDALSAIHAALESRRAGLAQARAARLTALRGTRADRRHAQRSLTRLIAQREKAARAVGPGGPWAIPWPVVQCESGGQNLPPNYATASGYYQMLDSTWAGLGGSTKHAYQASRAEQDRLAAKLWAGGSGAGNWVCAVLVGLA